MCIAMQEIMHFIRLGAFLENAYKIASAKQIQHVLHSSLRFW
jgi:hypothetical protein